MKQRILVIDDNVELAYALKRTLEQEGYLVNTVTDPGETIGLEVAQADLLIVDINLGQASGLDMLVSLREQGFEQPVIIITAHATPHNVITATRYGALDVLQKPFEVEQLVDAVKRSFPSTEGDSLTLAVDGQPVIGTSANMLEVCKAAGLASSNNLNVLLTGETGVGKEVIAKAIHQYSDRAKQRMVAINCSAIPESLLEAELFGYARGAFTGAAKETPGKIEAAEGGTLFLDEIGDIPAPFQAKLLRFLEDQTFYRLGETRLMQADVRVICATNRNLDEMVANGNFRDDLYFRLSQLTIAIPPLRERREDIKPLIELFIHQANDELGCRVHRIDAALISAAQNHHWPGNIRELKNAIFRAALSASNGVLSNLPSRNIYSASAGGNNIQECIDAYLDKQGVETAQELANEFEAALLRALARHFNNNKTHMCEALGISRNTLKVRLKEHGLSE